MTVLTEALQGCALVLTLNRPESRNALSTELVQALLEAVAQSRERKDVRALVIIGAGDKAFSAGTDLKERRTLSQAQKAAQSRSLLTLSEAIWDHPSRSSRRSAAIAWAAAPNWRWLATCASQPTTSCSASLK